MMGKQLAYRAHLAAAGIGHTHMKPSSSPSPPMLNRAEAIALVLTPLFLLVLICAVNFPNEFHLHALRRLRLSAFAGSADSPTAPRPPEFRLLMGILTYAERYQARDTIRLVNSLEPPVTAVIDVRFVLCNLTTDEQRVLVGLEIMRYGDIIVLDCQENMNGGKTYTYFSSVPKLFDVPYDFVMKTDDDTYFRFPELVRSLKGQPREDLYWGHVHVLPGDEATPLFACGMGYALSWDVVEWIAASEVARNRTEGHEDMLLARWLHEGGRGKNVFSTNGPELEPVMYDMPAPNNGNSYVPNTIAVHRVKDNQKWAKTLAYFNVTAGLKPSRFYHFE